MSKKAQHLSLIDILATRGPALAVLYHVVRNAK